MIEILLRYKVIIAIIVVAAVGVMWWGLAPAPEPPLVATENLAGTSDSDSDIVATLLQLRSVTLSGTIFSDPSFMSLRDFGVEITPEPVGRPNPFAPLTSTAITQGATTPNSSTREAQIFAPSR